MDQSTQGAGGTAVTGGTGAVGSEAAQESTATQVTGAESTQVQEPTIEVDGEQVPLSKVKAGLGALKTYTQTQQAQAARERELTQREIATKSAEGILGALSNPEVAAKVGEVAPEIMQAMPSREVQLADTLAAENLMYRFKEFAGEHPEFTNDQLAGIAAEAKNLALQGQFVAAKDFDSIGLRLYRDDILEAERKKAAAEALAQHQQALNAGVVPGGTAPIPPKQDLSKLNGTGKIAQGHAEREARGRSN